MKSFIVATINGNTNTYDYEGFKIAGAAVAVTGDEVVADHANFYKATLATGAVTIEKAGV